MVKEHVIQLGYELTEAIKSSDINFLNDFLYDDLLFLAPN